MNTRESFLRVLVVSMLTALLAACAGQLPETPTILPTIQPTAEAMQAVPTGIIVNPTATAVTSEPGQAADDSVATSKSVTGEIKVLGLVQTELGWTTTEIKAMKMVTAQGKNNKGESSSYSGVLIADLLNLAGTKPEATTITFSGDGGASLDASLAEVLACENCILTLRNQGGFSLLVPFLSEQLSLKGVKEIVVK